MRKYVIITVALALILCLAVSAEFTGASISTCFNEGNIVVSGSFDATSDAGKNYQVYLGTYDADGTFEKTEISKSFVIKEGHNTFEAKFEMTEDEQNIRAFVLTENLVPICQDVSETISYEYIGWEPAKESFYTAVSNEKYTSSTDFSKYLKSNENVTVVEGITIASRLCAMYNNEVITPSENIDYLHVINLNDASLLVDLSDRNTVNLDRINLSYAEGGINEDEGYLYATSTAKENGTYDPQVVINGLSLEARHYNKITLRMKYETVPEKYINLRNQQLQLFFKTNNDSELSEAKSLRYNLRNGSNLNDWFEIELDFSDHSSWKDVITGIRVDPLNNIAKFYIESVKFTKSENLDNNEWYDAYTAYATEKGIIEMGEFTSSLLFEDITRKQLFDFIIRAYPEEFFATVNSNIFGVPDVDKNAHNAEAYLLLYRAGITLGDDNGNNMNLDGGVSRSKAISIVNRLLNDENRLKGSVLCNWADFGSEYDMEFNSASDKDEYKFTRAANISVSDGKLGMDTQYDTYMVYNKSVTIDTERFTKLRLRFKAELSSESSNKDFEFFFVPEGASGFSTTYCMTYTLDDVYKDDLGWYIYEIDMCLDPDWDGTITKYRIDMVNGAANYTLDYIRFIESEYYGMPSTHEELVNAGYTATRLMQDEGFERGFYVSKVDQSVSALNHGRFTDYCETDEAPLWQIGPWWQGTGEGFETMDLIENRDTTTDKYTLADTYGINTIKYNPEEKSVSMRLNAVNIYHGEPHDVDTYNWWPHQLIEQNTNYTGSVDKERNSADADRMFVELDIRMTDFNNTLNADGRNVCSYLIYFYLRPKENPSQRIWFGLTVFNTSATLSNPVGLTAPINVKPNWSPDSAAHQYMYGMPQAVVFDGIENSFNPSSGVVNASDEWKHIRLDVTPHIDRAVEWANRDMIFGKKVTKEDMYFDGVNIGFEVHGNYDATFEFKNFNMVSYNLD